MGAVKIFLMLSMVFLFAACSNQAIYESIQVTNRFECAKLPLSQYELCMERANKSYREYERERKENLTRLAESTSKENG